MPIFLRDPYGIHFWPAFKGRDGCRTPMVWETGKPHAGFTTAEKPRLPVPYAHAMLAADGQERKPDSVLDHYKAMLNFRRSYASLREGEMDLSTATRSCWSLLVMRTKKACFSSSI